MGLIHTPVIVRNPADASKSWEGTFLVDTGAIDTLIPRTQLEAIGITPKGQREYVLADGSEAIFDIGIAQMEIMGMMIGTTIVFGEEGSESLLGAIAMQAAGLVIDPRKETLQRMPSMIRL